MLKPKTRSAVRHYRSGGRRPRRRGWGGVRPHGEAIARLHRDLESDPGMRGCFHSGVAVRATSRLLPEDRRFSIERERPIRLLDRKTIPDLIVRCTLTHEILLVIEVWHTHAVKDAKRSRFASADVRWIEVSCWHVIGRRRDEPLAVLDWGGFDEVAEPHQAALVPLASPHVAATGLGTTVFDVAASWQRRLAGRFSTRSHRSKAPSRPDAA